MFTPCSCHFVPCPLCSAGLKWPANEDRCLFKLSIAMQTGCLCDRSLVEMFHWVLQIEHEYKQNKAIIIIIIFIACIFGGLLEFKIKRGPLVETLTATYLCLWYTGPSPLYLPPTVLHLAPVLLHSDLWPRLCCPSLFFPQVLGVRRWVYPCGCASTAVRNVWITANRNQQAKH